MARIHSTNGRKKTNNTSDLFYVSVETPEKNIKFLDASEYIGRELPFKNPKMTVAVRATDDIVTFASLWVTKRVAKNITGQTIQMPGGSLKRLRLRAAELDVQPGKVIVEIAADEDNEAQMHTLTVTRDAAAVTQLSLDDVIVDDTTFQTPATGALKVSLYTKSPTTGRTVAVSYIGHLGGRPGAKETVLRTAGKVLNSLAGLELFRALTQIESVNVPMPPGNWANNTTSAALQEAGEAKVEKAVRLYTDDATPALVAAGTLSISVDLANANPATNKLQFAIVPSVELEEAWAAYDSVARKAISEKLEAQMGSGEITGAQDITNLAVDIIMGSMDAGRVDRLRAGLESIGDLGLTPTRYQA